MPLPNWLPPLLDVSRWTDTTAGQLYEVFIRDFKGVNLHIDGQRVSHIPDLEEDGKESIFWHLVQREDESTGIRLPDLARCARLPWVAAIISNANQPEVVRWDYRESKGHINTYLWLKEFDYVVILRKFDNGGRRLVTAHCVDGSGTKRTLERKFKNRMP
jgi:hypothetical protein